jgi:hypothetical protein
VLLAQGLHKRGTNLTSLSRWTSLDSVLGGCAETLALLGERLSVSRAKLLALAGCQQPARFRNHVWRPVMLSGG